ncbi:hypothetical protein SISNIDRAFT_456898 [Sistotremastrum niveocremeum HHB9708]|uniref:C2H2-type domain-containing protein n=2 Tax=Sistotremastraceae TaxID=3402574 RepID=A0A164SA84_9AGAM|nr:hypothetical protein SISNIDRAFT_456898 [Sistotremastrum niveocremeum HHB9708]KZT34199.1 hypothetical protein SISSUDRAFT_1053164 [Sistotremastrum suecicum HHB10207 ss-3]
MFSRLFARKQTETSAETPTTETADATRGEMVSQTSLNPSFKPTSPINVANRALPSSIQLLPRPLSQTPDSPTLHSHVSPPQSPMIHDRGSPNPSEASESTVVTSASLLALLNSVPPKTLHTFLTSRLHSLTPSELLTLSHILAELEPPPKLHCVRCHKTYVEVENDDRSCLVPHDDDSTEVERAGTRTSKRSSNARTGTTVSRYETYWGCCGQTVEGEGEQGPPSGWCYEGRHTTDIRRAKFRHDATPDDDKLKSCARRRCFDPPESSRARRGRKRSRTVAEGENDGADENQAEDVPMMDIKSTRRPSPSPSAVSVRSTRSRRRASPARSVGSTQSEAPPKPSKPVSKAAAMKPRARSKSVSASSRSGPKSKQGLAATIESSGVLEDGMNVSNRKRRKVST